MLSESDILQTLMSRRTRISGAAWLVVRNAHAAEDIFQNVAVKALTREVRFETEGALLSWALITTRREGIDWLRRHRHEQSPMEEDVLELLDREWLSEPQAPGGAKMEALQDCLESTPDAARRLLRMRYFDGFSCEEVSRRLGIELDAVYKRLSRLHAALKACIEGKLSGLQPEEHPGA